MDRQQQIQPLIQDWICWKMKSQNIVEAQQKLMGSYVPTPAVARTVILSVPLVFRGSFNQFQAAAERGIPVSTRLGDLLPPQKFLPRARKPHKSMPPMERLLCEQLPPEKYDITSTIVHDVTITRVDNGFEGAHLGLHCDAVPEAYMNMGQDDVKDLLKFFTDGEEVWCNKHIPAGLKAEHRIPVIREVANGYNSFHIARTFGGIYAGQQIMNGLIVLDPAVCQTLGLQAPKRPYVVGDNIDVDHLSEAEKSGLRINTWVLVPKGHAHTWVTTLPALQIRMLKYEIYELEVKNPKTGEIDVPWYIFDFLTIDKMNYFVGNHLIPKIDKRDIRGVTFTLQPFVSSQTRQKGSWSAPKWTDYVNQDLDEVRELKLQLSIRYTIYPMGMSTNPKISCVMTEDFPPMRIDGSLPLLAGGEEGARHGDPKKGRAQKDDMRI